MRAVILVFAGVVAVAGCASSDDLSPEAASTTGDQVRHPSTRPMSTGDEGSEATVENESPTSPSPSDLLSSTQPAITQPASTQPGGCPPPFGPAASDREIDFATTYCTLRAPVEQLAEELGGADPDAARLEELRSGLCSPGFKIPGRDQLEVQYGLIIRSTAQNDPELGERWEQVGIIDEFERIDGDDGSFLVNVEFNQATIDRLVNADLAFFQEVTANLQRYCD